MEMTKTRGFGSYTQLHFTTQEEENLIEFIKSHPLMYLGGKKTYKDMEQKDRLWKEVAMCLQRPVSECRNKWKNMRDYYLRSKKHYKQRQRGSRFESLNFLDTMEDKHLLSIHPDLEEQEDVKMVRILPDGPSTEVVHQLVPYVLLQQQQPEHQRHTESSEDDSQPPPMKRIKPLALSEKMVNELKVSSERLNHIHPQVPNEDIRRSSLDIMLDDPLDAFFLCMARTVKTFPPKFVAEAKMKVCNVIGEMELQVLSEQESKADH